MRERIQITQQAVRTDAMGNHVNVQVPYCSRWAYVNKMSGSETEEAGTTRSEESIYFIVRFDLGMKAINPAYSAESSEHYPLLHQRFSRDYAFHFAVGLPF